MADKSIDQLIAAENILATDLFVLQQSGMAKKLPGQVLLNWLTAAADGHGGIHSIAKLSTSGLADTYRITLADTTTFDFVVTNGRGVSSLRKTATSGLVDTYMFTYNDGNTDTFTVTNGAKGDKGDNANIWVKYASQKPTEASHSFGDIPDAWIGVSSGHLTEAPTDWQQYTWYQWKGEKGDTGEPATLVSSEITYQTGDSGTIIPSGTWSSSVPVVAQGKYLWTREITQFNTGNPIIKYSVSRFGIDGTGAVSTVAGVSPDSNGNVPLDAASVKALAISGGDMEGPINMNGQTLSGLNAPTENDHAANMGFVNEAVKKAAPRNLLDNSDFRNPVNQRGQASYSGVNGYTIDRWKSTNTRTTLTVNDEYITLAAFSDGAGYLRQRFEKDLNGAYTLAIMVRGTGTGNLYFSKDGASVGAGTITFQATEQWTIVSGIVNTANGTSLPNQFSIMVNAGESVDILWAALYESEYTADNLPVYQPKGYSVELAECQRYFYKMSRRSIFSGYFTASSKEFISTTLYDFCKMRTIPTVIASGSVVVRTLTGYSTAEGFTTGNGGDVSLLSDINMYYEASIRLVFNDAATGTNNSPGIVVFTEPIYFSADL